jgi:hypothetical protein
MSHTTITPSEACRELGHQLVQVRVAAYSEDTIEGCGVCSIAWQMARDETGDAKLADAFVGMLRTIVREQEDEDGQDEGSSEDGSGAR